LTVIVAVLPVGEYFFLWYSAVILKHTRVWYSCVCVVYSEINIYIFNSVTPSIRIGPGSRRRRANSLCGWRLQQNRNRNEPTWLELIEWLSWRNHFLMAIFGRTLSDHAARAASFWTVHFVPTGGTKGVDFGSGPPLARLNESENN